SFAVSATDVDLDDDLPANEKQTLTFTASNLPPGATLTPTSATSRQFSWTPVFTQTGEHIVTFRAEDNGRPQLSDTKTVRITATGKWATTSGPGGGTIKALFFDGTSLFAGTRVALTAFQTPPIGGSVFISANNGRAWTEVTGLPDQGVVAFGGTAADVFVISGTISESTSTTPTNVRGNSIFRSQDRGQTWTRLSGPPGTPSLKVITSLGQALFVGTDGSGVYRSTNN